MDNSAEAVSFAKERAHVALEATWEIENLAISLVDMLQIDVENPESYVHRAVAGRIKELSRVAMSVLGGDDARTTDDMRKLVDLASFWRTQK